MLAMAWKFPKKGKPNTFPNAQCPDWPSVLGKSATIPGPDTVEGILGTEGQSWALRIVEHDLYWG